MEFKGCSARAVPRAARCAFPLLPVPAELDYVQLWLSTYARVCSTLGAEMEKKCAEHPFQSVPFLSLSVVQD